MLIGCTNVAPINNNNAPLTQVYKVLGVSDGDTIKVKSLESRNIETIRLCGIDAPEKSQPFGAESKAKLQDLLAESNNIIQLAPIEKDRYGRVVGEVFIIGAKEKFINEEMVRSGMAYHYQRYSKNCPNRVAIANAEELAKSQRFGVWDGNHQKPWDYRRRKRRKLQNF